MLDYITRVKDLRTAILDEERRAEGSTKQETVKNVNNLTARSFCEGLPLTYRLQLSLEHYTDPFAAFSHAKSLAKRQELDNERYDSTRRSERHYERPVYSTGRPLAHSTPIKSDTPPGRFNNRYPNDRDSPYRFSNPVGNRQGNNYRPQGLNPPQNDSSREIGNPGRTKFCRYCKKDGHEIDECRKRQYNNSRQQLGNGTAPLGNLEQPPSGSLTRSVPTSESDSHDQRRNRTFRIAVLSPNDFRHAPTITLSAEGLSKDSKFMVDTGAAPNLIKPSSININYLGHRINLHMVTDDFPISQNGILGSDFLQDASRIDFSENLVMWQGHPIYFNDRETAVVPARSKTVLALRVMNRDVKTGYMPRIQVHDDLLRYCRVLFLVITIVHLQNQMTLLYHNVMQQKCTLERQVLTNTLSFATLQPDEFAYRLMNGPGHMAVTAGEAVHVIKYIPVEVTVRKTDECYNELPITLRNASLFLTPKSRIVTRTGNERECSTDLPTLYHIENTWIQFTPKPQVLQLPPQQMKPLTKLSWNQTWPPGHIRRDTKLTSFCFSRIEATLKDIQQKNHPARVRKPPGCFPFTVLEEIFAFNDVDQQTYDNVVSHFVYLGGLNPTDSAGHYFKCAFGNNEDVSSHITWLGTKFQRALKGTRFAEACEDAMAQNQNYRRPDNKEFGDAMSRALKSTKERWRKHSIANDINRRRQRDHTDADEDVQPARRPRVENAGPSRDYNEPPPVGLKALILKMLSMLRTTQRLMSSHTRNYLRRIRTMKM
ncbi:PREDICTED: uncharacterized protein LOC105557175 [Vollenhovia emeryi]|uniref:uncharacterized protein LOC105557175 n=1 Tax=Vollenhovia emeryi TaxID=411798 RepID=UPI0005F458C3|nr:PREDICTED: uncharacterized protein LOC105557175 [Vollenhovia emeryi]